MALLLFSVGLLASHAAAQVTLEYRVTYRDFLPAECLFESEYVDAWGGLRGSNDWDGVPDEWLTEPNIDTAVYPGSRTWGPQQWQGHMVRSDYCPYWTQVRAGLVKGHPDFEPRGTEYADGPACTVGCTVNFIETVVKPVLEMSPSGLRKVVYCNTTHPMARCGLSLRSEEAGEYTTSRAKYFESWYHDDPVYNRRVGQILTLTPTGDPFEYEYDSDETPSVPGSTLNPFFAPLNAGVSISQGDYPYDEVPLWPHSLVNRFATAENDVGSSKFWYTTEIHTYFEFRGDEEFEFSGDDDVWVAINGRLAVDLGGLHSPRTGSTNLANLATRTALNITPGNIYAFDMFHAERHTAGSNFKLTTSLVSNCNVVLSGTPAFEWPALQPEDWKLARAATFDAAADTLTLTTTNTAPFASSHAFLRRQVNVGTGFRAVFTVQLSKTGLPEGLAFVLHNRDDRLLNLPGSTGASLGFRNYDHSVAIAIDLCRDRFGGGTPCTQQRVAVHYANAAADLNDASSSTLRFYDGVSRTLKRDDETHEIRIEYLETPPWLEVYIDNSLYLRDEDFSPERLLGGRNAFVGFTTATSASPSPVVVTDFSLDAVRVDANQTVDVDLGSSTEPKMGLADGALSPGGFSVQMRDLCENVITYGGDGNLVKGVFVELPEPIPDPTEGDARRLLRSLQTTAPETYADGTTTPQVLNATIVDNDDGTYTAALASTVPGTFALHLCVGEDCIIDVTLDGDENSTELRNASVSITNAEFQGSVARAMRVLPLTARPTTSPTVSAPTQGPDTGSAVLGSAIGGGAALFALIMVGGILFILRRRWQRDRAFIEEGALYNMEREVTYDKNDEYSVVGRMVLSTTAAIQRERAQKAGGAAGKDADALAAENAELQEQIRLNKQKAQEQQQHAAAASIFSRGGKKGGKKKKEFATDPNL